MEDHVKQINDVVQIGNGPGGSVVIKADPIFASTVTQRLHPYQHFPRTLRPALQDVADYVRQTMIPEIFEQEGPGWRKLARRTQRERAHEGYNPMHPILKRTGNLMEELTECNHPNHIEVIKTGKEARIMISGSSEKFVRNQLGNWEYHIPQRAMLPGTGKNKISDRDKQQIVDILKKGIIQAAKKQ